MCSARGDHGFPSAPCELRTVSEAKSMANFGHLAQPGSSLSTWTNGSAMDGCSLSRVVRLSRRVGRSAHLSPFPISTDRFFFSHLSRRYLTQRSTQQDLKVVHEDEHIIVIDKPAGVLSTPGKDGNPSLQQAVFDAFGCESGNANKMACHRLGMDTSGLMVFAKTNHALRDLNSQFRTRKVTRKYEALVKGHVSDDSGVIDMPLMMDYENPPYMCVSTEEKQRALIGLSADDVGKKVLENPKESITEYEVLAREEVDGESVSRLSLTSVTGRTHQLNVHCSAIGHPIVGDSVYGDSGKAMCVHAKSLSFRHPGTREEVNLESAAPF